MTASVKIDIAEDTILIGIGASPGISIANSHLVNRARVVALERRIASKEVQAEIDAFDEALSTSREQLLEVKKQAQEEDLSEHLYIIDTHLLILEDQMLVDETRALVRKELVNAEGALTRTLGRLRKVFDAISDEYLRERRSDIDLVGDRIMRNLVGEERENLSDIEGPVIVVAHDLSPADTVQMDKEKIVGFVTDVGSRTAHTAILARSLGIPAVVGLETVTSLVPNALPMIIDGLSGTVVLNPSQETFREYLEKKQRYEYLEKELEGFQSLSAETRDGYHIALRANLDLIEEVDVAKKLGAEGIGLFRTEFLFMESDVPPTEEEQFAVYRQVAEKMAPYPVTIRTLDVGGDKFVPEFNLCDELNPVMGLRAVRFSLKEGRLFKAQLRAILRSSVFGAVRIMFPMISGIGELRACKQFLEEAKQELRDAAVAFNDSVQVGVMIETPSAVLVADLLAREADFFSVGTNDLIQYCLAIDRSNEHVAYLYEPLHPAVLRALKQVCQAAEDAGIEIGMCGEMAGEQLYCLVLIALGFRELSMNAINISRLKRIMRQVSLEEIRDLFEKLIDLPTAADVNEALECEMRQRFPDLFNLSDI